RQGSVGEARQGRVRFPRSSYPSGESSDPDDVQEIVFGVQPSGCKLNLELRSNPKQSLIFVPDSCISFFASVAKSGRALPTFLFWGSGMARPDGVDVESLWARFTALAEIVAAALRMEVFFMEIQVD